MMGFLADVGNSNLARDTDRALGLAVNLKKMEQDAQFKREEMDIKRQDLSLRQEGQESEIALRAERIAAAKQKNEENKRLTDWKLTPIKPSEHPLIQENLGPDGAAEFEKQMTATYGANGTLTREQFMTGLRDIHDNAEVWQKSVVAPAEKNWQRRMEVDSDRAEKAQTKFDSDPSQENYNKLQEAKDKLAKTREGESRFGLFKTKIEIQREMKTTLDAVQKADPDLYKEYTNSPDVQMAVNNADKEGFNKAIQKIREERKAFEVEKIRAKSRVDAAGTRGKDGMTENQRNIRDEKSKKELLDNYKADTVNIYRKYRLTAEQREFVERGDNPASVKGISKETATKLTKELSEAKLRYDDRYNKKFSERPLGSRRFTAEQQANYDEYSSARNKILNATVKKDGSKVSSEERNAALQSLDDEARADGLVE